MQKCYKYKNALADEKYHESSVPTFIINDEYKVSGVQQPEVFEKIFKEIIGA